MEYEFTLKFKLAADDTNLDDLVERLGAAGCDDALVGLGQPGRVGLEFVRDAASAEEAIESAIANVKAALPGAKLTEVSPDFVGLTDVAELVGVSRQNMRKLMVSHGNEFPAPVHDGSASVWHLSLVLQFLAEQRGQYKMTQPLVDVAKAAMRVNVLKEAAMIGSKIEDRYYALLI